MQEYRLLPRRLEGLLPTGCNQQFGGVSVVLNAATSTPPRTPTDFSAYMALRGSGHADTVNSYSSRAACFADLRDHAVLLMKWRDYVARAKAKATGTNLIIDFLPLLNLPKPTCRPA